MLAPLSFIHHRAPTTPSRRRPSSPTVPACRYPLPPTAPACRRPCSEEDRSSALEGGRRPRPRSEEDVGRCRWPTRARRRTPVTSGGAPTLTLGRHRPAHTAVVGLSSAAASRAARHYLSVTTTAGSLGPPLHPLPPANLLLLEKNCDFVRWFWEFKSLLCTKS
jgi:hypothetical protein